MALALKLLQQLRFTTHCQQLRTVGLRQRLISSSLAAAAEPLPSQLTPPTRQDAANFGAGAAHMQHRLGVRVPSMTRPGFAACMQAFMRHLMQPLSILTCSAACPACRFCNMLHKLSGSWLHWTGRHGPAHGLQPGSRWLQPEGA